MDINYKKIIYKIFVNLIIYLLTNILCINNIYEYLCILE